MSTPTFPRSPVLIVDDEDDVLQSYKTTLRFNRIDNFELCNDSSRVMGLVDRNAYSAMVLDLFMPHVTGQELLERIREKHPDIVVIVVTGSNDVNTAVECMKRGAYDYFLKPVDDSRLVTSLRNAIELAELRQENSALRTHMLTAGVRKPELFASIVTVSESMRSIFSYIEAIAASPRPVLITGESGTGKELVARALHAASGRGGKFVAVNVGGLDDTMFSDTLFGHRKGAFTGADADRPGLIEQARGGTLFLDEIGALQAASQIKLLRLLQEGEYYPLGSDSVKTAETTVIAATNEDLDVRLRDGAFRNDLYFRLLTHHIHVPPLRERAGDIPVLAERFVNDAASTLGKPAPAIPPEVMACLRQSRFPGNVRELQSLMFDAVTRCQGEQLDAVHFETYVRTHGCKPGDAGTDSSQPLEVLKAGGIPKLKDIEEYLIEKALEKTGNNQTVAAQMLGVSQSTLSRRTKPDGA
ncbi:MAG TPA: sigma-54 dependent transcriptional regulator [Chitinivibrionales bacterium]|jgi:DNA-binding NtrC family response regulator|nr:sigma-54 dependent transcriptional regulator [Chitinivibrionales bacterium]